MRFKRHDLSGKRIGRLTVAWPVGIRCRTVVWLCFCVCGNSRIVRAGDLLTGRTRRCREEAIKAITSHGESKGAKRSLEYQSWYGMIARCTNPHHIGWKNYGGRGIRVCTRWLKYEHFLADMGRRPGRKHSIDRINNDGNYEPKNCRWATVKEQSANRRPRAKAAD